MPHIIQITKNHQVSTFLGYIQSKYQLLTEEEIIRLLISKEYSFLHSQEQDETEYLLSSPANQKRLEEATKQDFTKAKQYANLDNLKSELLEEQATALEQIVELTPAQKSSLKRQINKAKAEARALQSELEKLKN